MYCNHKKMLRLMHTKYIYNLLRIFMFDSRFDELISTAIIVVVTLFCFSYNVS